MNFPLIDKEFISHPAPTRRAFNSCLELMDEAANCQEEIRRCSRQIDELEKAVNQGNVSREKAEGRIAEIKSQLESVRLLAVENWQKAQKLANDLEQGNAR